MKKLLSIIAALFAVIILSGNSAAQQWSNEQKDVWTGVQKYWEAYTTDAKSFLTYVDESYMGWDFQSKVPQNKMNSSKWIEYSSKNSSTVLYTLTPLAIWVKGDFAYAHYIYAQLTKDNETGNKENSDGTWTDILMKQNGKWVLIGDRGGRTSKEE